MHDMKAAARTLSSIVTSRLVNLGLGRCLLTWECSNILSLDMAQFKVSRIGRTRENTE